MNLHYFCRWCVVAALVTLGTSLLVHKSLAAPPAPGDGTQVLTRGPVHEAFAETVTYDPQPGVVVPKAPPAAIEELPPEQKLDGANVAWIPGYWGWDDERNDFLWVSGIWRDLPPGRQWVPGYWGQAAQGSQWTSGYWADSQVSNVQYLPEPPATAESGPNIAAPSPDSTWLPGAWMWQQNRYAWRPGFWAAAQPDWDWIPAHYIWAPRGYVFVDGYWDYSIGRRGVLFAPVYFNDGIYAQAGFSYSPTVVINPSVFSDSLFLRPQYQHYYFGDYYAANYQTAGFYPSYSYNSDRYGYDPIYAHERWQHRRDGQWEQHVAADFQNRRDHVDARPPRTWAAENAPGAAQSRDRGIVMATPLNSLVRSKDSPLKFQPVGSSERQKLGQQAQQIQKFGATRQKLETGQTARADEQPARTQSPATVKLPRSPIVARPSADLAKDHVPPQAHVTPKPDLTVEAKPRATRPPEQPQPRTVNRLPLDTPQPRPEPQPKPRPSAERPAPQPQAQPQPQPKPQPQPQPKPQPQPQPQPKPQPQPTPRVDRPAAERPADRPAAEPKPEKDKAK